MTHIRGIPPINMGEGLRILGETFDSQGFPNTQTYDGIDILFINH